MCDCQDCNCQNSDSGFIFGLVIGAVIGAAVAVYIYKHNKTDVFVDLREKLENFFKDKFSPEESKPVKSEKIAVILPKEIVKESTPVKTVISKPRKFVKPKK